MEKIKILSDSSCDLSAAQLKENNITLIPFSIILGTQILHDGVNIDAKGVLDYVEQTGELPKTAATKQEEYYSVFKKYLQQDYKVIHFGISSKASASFSFAKKACEQLESEGFEGKIFGVDSKALSTGQGLQILKTVDYIKAGMTFDQIREELKTLPEKVQTSFIVDRLDFLHKGGRCSLLALLGAKVLKIHPSISSVDGQLKVKRKYTGVLSRCLSAYVKDLAADYPQYDRTRCFITHSPSDKELVDMVIDEVKSLFDFDAIIETEAGPTVTAHCGYNTIGVLFITE